MCTCLEVDSVVKAFKEKPDLETAKKYLQAGNYYWNAGLFIWNVAVREISSPCSGITEAENRLC